jgi:branched-chain amino acid transport system substrate-binding protein
MKRLGLCVTLSALILAGGCGQKKVLIGVVLPETGDSSPYGTSLKTGIKLAFDGAVAAKKAPAGLEVIYRDSGSNPTLAATQTEALFNQGAVIVIGGATSTEARSMIPVAEKTGGVILSPSASAPELAASSNLFFRVFPSDSLEGARAAKYLVVDRKLKQVLVVEEDNPYTHGLLPVFTTELKKLGGEVVGTVNIGADGWEKQLMEALDDKPEALYVCGYGEAILQGLLEIRGLEYPGVVLTTSAISTVDLVWRGGRLVEGVTFPATGIDFASQQEPMKSFVARYKDANNNLVPDLYAAHGFDTAWVALWALEGPQLQGKTELLERLLGMSGRVGVTGPLSFDEVGNANYRLRMQCVRGGKVEDCDPEPRS